MKCSIIIPTRQRSELLSATLDSLAQQTDKDFEVVVVCDGEDPPTRELAARYRAVYPLRWIFSQENEGQAAARNRGALAAEGEWLLFLDDDMIPSEDWVFLHRQNHENYGEHRNVVVYGKIVETYQHSPRSHTERFLRSERERGLAILESAYQRREMEFGRHACFGVNSSIRRGAFFAVGGFDPALRFVGEDFELGSRLHDHGIQFHFEPFAIVRHRNTKDPIEHFSYAVRSWAHRDLHRVRERRQRNEQTRLLASIGHGSPVRLLTRRMAWYWPRLFEMGARVCQPVVDATGSESCFRLWHRLRWASYWQALRSHGVTLDWILQCAGSPVPALMFHSISVPEDRAAGHYCVSPRRFLKLAGWLQMTGYKPLLPGEYLAGVASPRPVLLTFDDGYEDFYGEVFPLLQQMGWKATVFLVADRIGQSNVWDENILPKRRLLSLEQIREMHRHGVQFGSHSLTHPFLTRLSAGDLRREVADSKARLEDLLGSEVSCFAYPYGDLDLRVRGAVAEAGYKVAMTTQEGLNFWTDPFCLKRVNVGEKDTLLEFALKVTTGVDYRQKLGAWLRRARLAPDFNKA